MVTSIPTSEEGRLHQNTIAGNTHTTYQPKLTVFEEKLRNALLVLHSPT